MNKEYITPETKIVDAFMEGMLCASKDPFNGEVENWVEEDFAW